PIIPATINSAKANNDFFIRSLLSTSRTIRYALGRRPSCGQSKSIPVETRQRIGIIEQLAGLLSVSQDGIELREHVVVGSMLFVTTEARPLGKGSGSLLLAIGKVEVGPA